MSKTALRARGAPKRVARSLFLPLGAMFDFFKRFFGGGGRVDDAAGLDVAQLALRLKLTREQLQRVRIGYTKFEISKRTSAMPRTILAPNPELKHVQRLILRRLLNKLR